jgi:hypothetical protein
VYGKIFQQMYEGSMCTTGPWQAVVTFQQFIVLAQSDGVLDWTAEAIARKTTIPLEIILAGIEALERPDPDSRSPDEDGRRIVRLSDHRPWGWRVVNYAKYAAIRDEEARREYQREWDRTHRAHRRRRDPTNPTSARHDPTNSTPVQHDPTSPTHKDTDKDKDEPTVAPRRAREGYPLEFEEIRRAFPKRAGSQPWSRAFKACRARLAEGSTWLELREGTRRYAAFILATGKPGTQYVLQAATFFGPDKQFAETWEPPAKLPAAADSGWQGFSR